MKLNGADREDSMALAEKVYDYKVEKVKSELFTAFKRRNNESTVSDLVAVTGLPKYQIEQTARIVLDEYSGHMKVTESGEILYYFPKGMHSRYRGFGPGLKRFLKTAGMVLGKVFRFLFKVWIMLMLVLYFVLFLAIVLLAVFAAIAGSASSKSNSRSRRTSGSGGMFYLVIRLLELFLRIFFWVKISGKEADKPQGRPFYKSVFGFVFGDKDPNSEWDSEMKVQIISYIRKNKGILSVEELMCMTGSTYDQAQTLMNSFLVEYEGEPLVSDSGTLYCFFPELLRTRKEELLVSGVDTVFETKKKKIVPFSENKKGNNVLIGFFNGFNLFFGTYFTAFSLMTVLPIEDAGLGMLYSFVHEFLFNEILGVYSPTFPIFIILGLIPLVFSFLFYIIPLIRSIMLKAKNDFIKAGNLRKKLFSSVYSHPIQFDPATVKPDNADEAVANAMQFLGKETDGFAAIKHADVEKTDDNRLVYNFTELDNETKDLIVCRKSVDISSYEVGGTVFDSNA